ncbi:sensor histidine kinase [Paenibacillus sinopodophylli]|uniref:sensor histidine kinase n=1 Tax=Paenibacillus sinopodophylli TaxID=1837342 RepID=UPI0014869842|nr:histidine kinase [Paenibacillus sinopodophylli]
MRWLYRISFYRQIQLALLLFLTIPLLLISVMSYMTNKQANEENVRSNMKGIIGTLANDISKTANDVIYTVNQYSASQLNHSHSDLRKLKAITSFETFADYQSYMSIAENMSFYVGKLSLLNVHVLYLNQAYYPLVGSAKPSDIASLRKDERFEHLPKSEASTGIVQWFREEQMGSFDDVLQSSYYLFLKKSIYDPIRHEVLGTLFVGIPHSYFDSLFHHAGQGVFSLYEQDGSLLAGVEGSPAYLIDGADSGKKRETVPVSGTTWTLVYDLDTTAVFGDITQRFWYTLLAVCIVLFVFLFISSVIAKGLNRPIHKLMRVASQYGEGNSSVRYLVTGQNEISLLGKSINDMLDNINALISKLENEQEEKRTIELYALFSQIQPHFLFNTLNSIKCNLAIEGDQVHSETIDSLMALLRAHLKVHEPLTLADECKLLSQYISIIRMRNRLNIKLDISLPDHFRDVMIPRLLLQPLVENSIIHGFNRSISHPLIEVKIREAFQGIEIRVSDNGRGTTLEQVSRLNQKFEHEVEQARDSGIGLYNVYRRLKLTFGNSARLSIELSEENRFVSKIYIPMNKDREDKPYVESDAGRR